MPPCVTAFRHSRISAGNQYMRAACLVPVLTYIVLLEVLVMDSPASYLDAVVMCCYPIFNLPLPGRRAMLRVIKNVSVGFYLQELLRPS